MIIRCRRGEPPTGAFPTFYCPFCGREGPGPVERWMQGGRVAALHDLVRLTSQLPGATRIVVATPERGLADEYPDLPVTWDFDPPDIPLCSAGMVWWPEICMHSSK